MLADIATEYEALVQFLYLAPVGLAQITTEGEILLLNPVSAQLLMPLSRDGGLANLFIALEDVAPDLRHLAANFEHGYGLICDGLCIPLTPGAHGTSAQSFLSLSLLKLDSTRLMAVLNDITQQVRRERLLKQNEAWLNAILTGISDYALVSLDSAGRVEDWNPSIARVTGYSREAVLGRPFTLFYPENATTPDRMRDRLREADENGWSLDDGWRLRADGTQFWGSAMIAPLYDRKHADSIEVTNPGAAAYCLVIRDITEKREASENQRRATSCDHLTGIANRRAFFEAAELEFERWHRAPRPLSLILFDADHFKKINDTYGHPMGDTVLRHLAALLGDSFRPVDIVARVGGEEFAVLLPSTDIVGAEQSANRLRAALESQTLVVDGVTLCYTVSGGVAQVDNDANCLDALLKRADQALYAAKAGGRNHIVRWSPDCSTSSGFETQGRA